MKKQKMLLNFLVIFVLTLAVLWLALKDNYQEILTAISQMKPIHLLLILCWGTLYTIVWGLVYFVMGRKYVSNYSVGKGIIVAFVGSFFAGITPSSTGGQFAQAYMMKKQGIKVSDAASLLWADFIIYQTTLMIYVTVLFALRFQYYSSQSGWFNIILLGYIVNAVVIVALYTMALFPKVYIALTEKVANLLGKLHILKDPEKTKDTWNLQATSFTREIKQLSRDVKRIVLCGLINVVRLTLLFSLPFFIGLALDIPLQVDKLFDVIVLSSFVTMANSFIPIPGASGGTEVVFNLLFMPMMGLLTGAVMILWRFSTYHVVLFIGGIIFSVVKNYYSRKEIKEQENNIQVD